MSDPALVLDLGSFSMKAGLSTDEVPHVIRSVTGRSRLPTETDQKPYLGDSALVNGNSVSLSEPISEGIVEDFSDLELLLDFIFFLATSKTSYTSDTLPVVLAEPSFNSAPNREHMAEVLFEKFNAPELNMTMQGILSLVGTGRVTGLVLDCGHGSCQTVPVFESYVLPHSIGNLRLGGRDLDVLLAKLIALQDVSLAKTSDREVLRRIKHEMCFCRKSADASFSANSMNFKLPDGQQIISLAEERFIVPEALFSPSLVGAEGNGLGALVAECIKNSPIDLTKPLVSNIILSGGCSLFENFPNRLTAEVKQRVSANMSREVRIVANEDRLLSTWNGGKAFADLRESFMDRWMTRAEYEEFGVGHIHSKVMSVKTA